ncbi:MAG: glucuronate isomerase [Clostridia bacterium]|nr:glucuronate isomerase [Clostridia bacterium]
MKDFMNVDFLLNGNTTKLLYQEVSTLPIIDYHCHIDAKEIYDNLTFDTITEAWLKADHYKWRAMRNMGVDERLITGDAEDYDKFVAWATIMPYLAGHPLYHFSHMELKKYMGITTPLSKETAGDVYQRANKVLRNLPVRELIKKSNVEVVVTTNDPIEDLRYHTLLKEDGYSVKVLPAFRPDKALNVEKDGYAEYIEKLESVVGFAINDFASLKLALVNRLDYFVSLGCKASDHGLDSMPFARNATTEILDNAVKARAISNEYVDAFKTELLLFLAKEYVKRNVVMELHFGCKRNPNAKTFKKLGVDTGFDAILGATRIDNLYPLLNAMAEADALPKTLLFSLNPADNAELVTIMGSFNEAPFKGKVQQGSAWWFNDNKGGMENQISTYALGAPIDTFIGMLTDSRSFLSYERHDYFRRILCNFLGSLVDNGEYPLSQLEYLKEIARNICYYNAKNYFNF